MSARTLRQLTNAMRLDRRLRQIAMTGGATPVIGARHRRRDAGDRESARFADRLETGFALIDQGYDDGAHGPGNARPA